MPGQDRSTPLHWAGDYRKTIAHRKMIALHGKRNKSRDTEPAMSEENVEQARTLYDLFNQRGVPPWEFIHSDVVFDASNIVGLGVLKGREEALSGLREYTAAWEEWRIEPEEFLDAGDQVMATVLDGGRLKATGTEVHNRFYNVLTFRDGKLTHWKTFTVRSEALEAAGLSG